MMAKGKFPAAFTKTKGATPPDNDADDKFIPAGKGKGMGKGKGKFPAFLKKGGK